jgi:hypothetical protein
MPLRGTLTNENGVVVASMIGNPRCPVWNLESWNLESTRV